MKLYSLELAFGSFNKVSLLLFYYVCLTFLFITLFLPVMLVFFLFVFIVQHIGQLCVVLIVLYYQMMKNSEWAFLTLPWKMMSHPNGPCSSREVGKLLAIPVDYKKKNT